MNWNETKTRQSLHSLECPGFDECVQFSISDLGNGEMALSWSSSTCYHFSITGVGSVYASHGYEILEIPYTTTNYTMKCYECNFCEHTIRVYPDEMGGITPDGPNYNCNHEFYDYSFEISDHREYNYYAYNIGIGKGNMPIDVYKIRITHCEPEDPYDEFEPHDITDWEESGELGDLLPAAPGCTYEIHFSNRYCMKKDEHYFCVPYSYEDVMNAPCALNGYIVNNHSK